MNSEIHKWILNINKEHKLNSDVILENNGYYFKITDNLKIPIYPQLPNTQYNDMRTISFLQGFYYGRLLGRKNRKNND